MMAAESNLKPTVVSEVTGDPSSIDSGDYETTIGHSIPLEEDITTRKELNEICNVLVYSVPDTNSNRPRTEIAGQLPTDDVSMGLKGGQPRESTHISSEQLVNKKQHCVSSVEGKENIDLPCTSPGPDNIQEEDSLCPRSLRAPLLTSTLHGSAEAVRRSAQEDSRVDVVFPGTVTPEGCCRFVTEVLKCVLYQRQQLPMTYDQLVYSQKKQQASMQNKELVSWRPVQSADLDWRKCQRTLQDLEEMLQQLEVLFSLSRVPRVLLLLGGSLVLPKELYEINMEALLLAAGDQSLRVSPCLRQLFRTLFVADLLSDARPVHLMATTVLALAHRDCGVGWFRPKLHFKMPTRVKSQIIALSTDPSICGAPQEEVSGGQDYVWFQAPVTIKGFSK